MTVLVRFLGVAAFEIITSEGKRLLIDPYLDDNPLSPIKVADLDHLDLLLVTHSAYNHMGDAEAILRRFPGLPLICGADVRGYLMHQGIDGDRIRAIPWGVMVEDAGVRVRSVESHHWSYIESDDGRVFSSIPLGFVVYAGDDQRIYHSGDTAIFSDMKLLGDLYQPTVGLINVGMPRPPQEMAHCHPEYLTGEMDVKEAVLASQWLGLRYAIPCHYDDPTMPPELVRFEELLGQVRHTDPAAPEPVILCPGQTLRLPQGAVEQ